MIKKILLYALLLCLCLSTRSDAISYIAEPVLVTQPVYSGMSFYVYRPYNMPAGWFVTYDGYPVLRGRKGNWIYGIPCQNGLVPSNYIVGSVEPTSTPTLVQIVQPALLQMTSIRQNEQLQFYIKSTQITPASTSRWLSDKNFTAVTKWPKMVDRLAVLNKPRIPLAWKGDSPKAIYAWIGKSWFQIKTRANESPADTIKRNVYVLTRMKKQNNFIWNDSDTSLLASQAPVWGYLWMGLVAPINF